MTAPPPLAHPAVEPYRYTRPGPQRARTPIAPTDRVSARDHAAEDGLDTPAHTVLARCRPGSCPVGDLPATTGLSPGVLLVVLTDLEQAGLVTITAGDQHSGGGW